MWVWLLLLLQQGAVDGGDVGGGDIAVAVHVAIGQVAVGGAQQRVVDGGHVGSSDVAILIHVARVIGRGDGACCGAVDAHLLSVVVVEEAHEVALLEVEIVEGKCHVLLAAGCQIDEL